MTTKQPRVSIYSQALRNATKSQFEIVREQEHNVRAIEATYGRGSTDITSPNYDDDAAFALYCRENRHLDI